jgi:hypothetical protein
VIRFFIFTLSESVFSFTLEASDFSFTLRGQVFQLHSQEGGLGGSIYTKLGSEKEKISV